MRKTAVEARNIKQLKNEKLSQISDDETDMNVGLRNGKADEIGQRSMQGEGVFDRVTNISDNGFNGTTANERNGRVNVVKAAQLCGVKEDDRIDEEVEPDELSWDAAFENKQFRFVSYALILDVFFVLFFFLCFHTV